MTPLLLPVLVLTPLVGAAVIFLTWRNDARRATRFAIAVAALALGLGLVLARYAVGQSHPTEPVRPRLLFAPEWLSIDMPIAANGKNVHWQFQLGADGFGVWMVLLTSVVTLATLIVASKLIEERTADYLALLLAMESAMLGVFLSMDLLLFYVFFEATLFPLVLLMAGWGGANAWPATRKFLLYTLAGSIPMAVGLAGLAFSMADASGLAPTISIPELARAALERSQWTAESRLEIASTERWIFWLLFLGFGIKMAILPFHSWLPTAYTAVHPTTTALFAGVVLKFGLFGFLRIGLPLIPEASLEIGYPLLGALGAAAIVFGALAALAQTNLLSLLAYCSISHVGFITLGLFAFNTEGIGGAALQMVNHGLTTAALFLLAAIVIDRRRTASLKDGPFGLALGYPRLAVLLIFFLLAGAGLPGLNNFVGELMGLAGMIQRSVVLSAIAASGVLLGAWYSLRFIQILLFGPSDDSPRLARQNRDLCWTQTTAIGSIGLICLAIGVRPQWALDVMKHDVEGVASLYSQPSGPMEQSTELATGRPSDGNGREERQ